MKRNMKMRTIDKPTSVRCGCGCGLTVLPAGVRIDLSSSEKVAIECKACGKTTMVPVVREAA